MRQFLGPLLVKLVPAFLGFLGATAALLHPTYYGAFCAGFHA